MANQMHDIVDTAVAAGIFKTLIAAVGAAEGSTHTHPHQHNATSSFSISDFISAFFYFRSPPLKQTWPSSTSRFVVQSYQFEILRPPIQVS
ncbi:MAG: hypothetical protein H7256_14965 [Bdellovibrio sp.]|nr:hypothetical protein [Bdellovibrio sp.]